MEELLLLVHLDDVWVLDGLKQLLLSEQRQGILGWMVSIVLNYLESILAIVMLVLACNNYTESSHTQHSDHIVHLIKPYCTLLFEELNSFTLVLRQVVKIL